MSILTIFSLSVFTSLVNIVRHCKSLMIQLISMIKPGIKIGPKDWKDKLIKSQAKYCEVWFRVDKLDWYKEMFSYLKENKINTGLHFWGLIDNRLEPNIAYPGPTLNKSLDLMKQAIDIAAFNHFNYVNIHQGNYNLIEINLEKSIFKPASKDNLISIRQAETIQKQSLKKLLSYAKDKNVLLLVESATARSARGGSYDLKARLKTRSQHTLPVKTLIYRAKNDNAFVTNDFGHIFCDEFDKPVDKLWQALWEKSVLLAPFTKLLHINSVIPPFNGTDTHHGITEEDFKIKGIFPTKDKLKKLLSLFKNRDDVWAIGEPRENHVANFNALKKLLTIAYLPG